MEAIVLEKNWNAQIQDRQELFSEELERIGIHIYPR
jgi:hypothetical protein